MATPLAPAAPTSSSEVAQAAVIEVDASENLDADSVLGGASAYSETTSLASSITKFRLENGRRYHALKDGSYTVPNDDIENERLDIQHYSCLLTLDGRLYTAPIGDKPLRRVLDGGCGIGNWTIDFADAHPETKVIGVDLSPVQSTFVPPNVEFFVDDIEAEWTYSAPFDFIYLRMLLGAIGDWPKLIAQAYRHTTPGGYVELMDAIYPAESDDGTLTEDSAVYRWNKLLTEAAAKSNRHLDVGRNHKQNLIDAGFQNVTETRYKWPINSWPKDPKFKDLGAWTLENFLQGLQGFTLALFTRVLGWTQEEIELFLIEVRKESRDRRIHAYWHVVVVHGQRPEEEAGAGTAS